MLDPLLLAAPPPLQSPAQIGATPGPLPVRDPNDRQTMTAVRPRGDAIMPPSPQPHPDLRNAAANLSAHSDLAGAKTATAASRSSGQSSWLGTAANFADGVGEGMWDGLSGMVQSVGDLGNGGYTLATSARARSQAIDTISNGATAAGQVAKSIVADPARAAQHVGHAANHALDGVAKAYGKAAASGHASEFVGKLVGQGAVAAASLMIPEAGFGKVASGLKAVGGIDGVTAGAAKFAGDASRAIKLTASAAVAKGDALAAKVVTSAGGEPKLAVAVGANGPLAASGPTANTLESRAVATATGARRNVAVHEATGGHTIERHVGKSDTWLSNRLAKDPDLDVASTFTNDIAANRTQGMFVNKSKKQIVQWLNDPAKPQILVATFDTGAPIGRVLQRGENTSTTTSKANLVLTRDGSAQGWHFLTSFPVK